MNLLSRFLESEDSPDDFLKKQVEDGVGAVTTTSMPGADTLPQHAHLFRKEDFQISGEAAQEAKPESPAEATPEAIANAEKEQEVTGAGPTEVPETGSGEDYEPKELPAPKPNIDITPVEDMNK